VAQGRRERSRRREPTFSSSRDWTEALLIAHTAAAVVCHVEARWMMTTVRGFATRVSHQGDRSVIKWVGEADLAAAPRAKASVAELEVGPGDVVELDLGELTFMDSTGIRTLLSVKAMVEEARATFVLTGAPLAVWRLLEITGVDLVLGLGSDAATEGPVGTST